MTGSSDPLLPALLHPLHPPAVREAAQEVPELPGDHEDGADEAGRGRQDRRRDQRRDVRQQLVAPPQGQEGEVNLLGGNDLDHFKVLYESTYKHCQTKL